MEPYAVSIIVVASIWSVNGIVWFVQRLTLGSLIRRKAAAEAEAVELSNHAKRLDLMQANMMAMRNINQEMKAKATTEQTAEVKPDSDSPAASAT